MGRRRLATAPTPGERPQTREVQAANGFSSQHDAPLHFGLGAAAPDLVPIRIRWCGGATTEHRLARDAYHVVQQQARQTTGWCVWLQKLRSNCGGKRILRVDLRFSRGN